MSWSSIHDWRCLDGAASEFPDPYLIWAQVTRWCDVMATAAGEDAADEPVSLAIELKNATASAFRTALERVAEGVAAHVPDVYADSRFLTASLPRHLLGAVLDPRTDTGSLIRRADLSMPVCSLRPRASAPDPVQPPPCSSAVPPVRGSVLMGVIDSGCPFARRSLLAEVDGSLSTRMAAIWGMGRESAFADTGLARMPARMGYGMELVREGLDQWIAQFVSPGGSVDEQACYAEAGHHQMRSSVSHGAHVLDLLAGPVSLSHRVSTDLDLPPDWLAAGDAASDAGRTDLVFVQLPTRALDDSSGSWLGSHVLDAVNYLVSCAGDATKHLLINLSYGCTTGPHDGSSILERALDDVVSRGIGAEGQQGTVEIVMAAGNSFAERGHCVLTAADFDGDGQSTEIVWRILPGSEAPSFMQLWLPGGLGAEAMRLRIVPPGGAAIELGMGQVAAWPECGQPAATAIFLQRSSRGEGSPMILLAVAPTDTAQAARPPAPHGEWILQFRAHSSGALRTGDAIHAYIARSDHDIGTPVRGRQSYFADALDEPSRHLRSCADDPGLRHEELDGPADRRGSIVRRRGTLNGIATGSRLQVVAGYRLHGASHAPYSSAGRKESDRGASPTSACVTDESACMPGVRAGGTASGSAFRLVGTSTAAPQWMRRLANDHVRPHKDGTGSVQSSAADPADPSDLWGVAGRLRP